MLKVVYFDEGSATDFLLLKNGGNLVEEVQEEKKTGSELEGKAKAKVGIGKGIKKLLKTLTIDVDAEVSGEGAMFRNTNKLVLSSITNTILNDFVEYSDNQEEENREIKILKDYKVNFAFNSVAYLQRISPYLVMTEGDIQIDEGLKINVNRVHETIKESKGYYDVIASKKDKKDIILRFNNKSFRNNYSVAELDQMDLKFYGVRVGKMSKSLLNIELLFEEYSNDESDSQEVDHLDKLLEHANVDNVAGDVKKTDELFYVYDIVLAGVE